jgi:hypothetical protein
MYEYDYYIQDVSTVDNTLCYLEEYGDDLFVTVQDEDGTEYEVDLFGEYDDNLLHLTMFNGNPTIIGNVVRRDACGLFSGTLNEIKEYIKNLPCDDYDDEEDFV